MKNLYNSGLAGILCGALASLTAPVFAEEGKIANFFKGVEISGFIDTYYSYNFSKPDDQRGSTPGFTRDSGQGDWLDVRAFDRENNSFTLDNVEIAVFKPSTEKDPIGFGFITNYGEIAQRLTFVSSDGRVDGASGSQSFTISQGFVTYRAPVGEGLDFKFGKFASWIGAELCQSVDNPNFSRSLLYENAITWTNTGLAISYPLLDRLTTSFYLVNGWDTFVDNNSSKTAGYQFNWAVAENTSFIVNGSHGPEQTDNSSNYRHFWDLVLATKPFEKTTFNLNFDFGTEESGANDVFGKDTADQKLNYKTGKWWGFAGIISRDITDIVGLAFRGEYFDDRDGARRGVDNLDIWEITFTTNIKIRESLLVRPEVRYDKANQGIFNGHDGELTTAIDLAYMF
ncbi:MAG TPA: outer membrane beta-barrel protein [Candidatus Brocadiaceae bacterium]|nr:outer membrane beta-barrel protein [Candidatus Brocadiaceae bacterium]